LNLPFRNREQQKLGIAVADAFIACRDAKYRYNLLRPISCIQQVIDPNTCKSLHAGILCHPFSGTVSRLIFHRSAWRRIINNHRISKGALQMNEETIIIEKLADDEMKSVVGGNVGTAEMSWLTDVLA
jgi:hypothetical protein